MLKPKSVPDPVHVIDWFPTLAALLGYEEAANFALDGVDLDPVLFREGSLETRSLYWIWNSRTNRWALRYGDWKIVKYGEGEPVGPGDWQLYNLRDDPQESADLAAQHPGKVSELHQMFLVHRSKDEIKRTKQ
jgi:arylsulfatase A-like enzyme